MDSFVLFLHFFGLMLGSAGGLASGIIMRRAAGLPPEQGQTIRALGPLLANVGAAGLGLLWLTGLFLVFSKWGGFGSLPGLFWVKFAFVVVMTGLIGYIQMTYAEMRRTKNPALGSRLAILGPASGVTVLLVVLFAAYAFP